MNGKRFADYLTESKCPYNNCAIARRLLNEKGFTELHEEDPVNPETFPKRGFYIRDEKNLVAFDIGGFNSSVVVSAHNDSPSYKLRIKPDASGNGLHILSVAGYANVMAYASFGRGLCLAGSVLVDNHNGTYRSVVINSQEPIAIMPFPNNYSTSPQTQSSRNKTPTTYNPRAKYEKDESTPISMNINRDTELTAIYGLQNSKDIMEHIAELANASAQDIVAHDLYLVDARPATVFSDFITSPRIDNLACSYGCLYGLIESNAKDSINICAIFDNEEIGSRTRHGALGNLLSVVYSNISKAFKVDLDVLYSKSLICSADANHSAHPNFSYGEVNHPNYAQTGVSLKTSYKGNYAYDQRGNVIIKEAAKRNNTPLVVLSTKNGRRGGGTIGPKMEALHCIATVDIGHSNWAMHSFREMMAWKDAETLVDFLKYLLNNYDELRQYAGMGQ